jgi:hypothetical protein
VVGRVCCDATLMTKVEARMTKECPKLQGLMRRAGGGTRAWAVGGVWESVDCGLRMFGH